MRLALLILIFILPFFASSALSYSARTPHSSFYPDVASRSIFLSHAQSPPYSAPVQFTTSTWTELGPRTMTDSSGLSYSGRVTAIAVNSTNPNIIYIGSAQGGIWKTADSGNTWVPLSDSWSSLAIGSIAISDDGKTIYVGTGEPNHSWDSYGGDGIHVSSDGGKTWSVIGTNFRGDAISSIVLFPSNSQRILVSDTWAVCCKGLYSPSNGPFGIFLSVNGGSAWTNVLSTPDGVAQIVANSSNPNILYAADFDGGMWVSHDAGSTWQVLYQQTSPANMGRVAISLTPANPSVLYAAFSDSSGELIGVYSYSPKTKAFSQLSNPPIPPSPAVSVCDKQCWYDLVIYADPKVQGLLYFGALDMYVSSNNGASWTDVGGYSGKIHEDQHALVFTPSGSILVGNDGGIWTSNDRGSTWLDLNNGIGTIQFYSIAGIPPSFLFGGTQDNGCEQLVSGTSWKEIVTGDGGWAGFEPTNHNIMYCNYIYLNFQVSYDGGVSWQLAIKGINVSEPSLFIAPAAQDPNNPGTVYIAGTHVYRTTNYAQSWQDVSGQITSARISAIAIAPSSSSILYAGDILGNVMQSTSSGSSWSEILHEQYPVASLAVFNKNPRLALVAFAGLNTIYQVDTSSGTPSVTALSPLPSSPNVIKISQDDKEIFVGTDKGVYYSSDGGKTWSKLGTNLPNSAIYDMILYQNQLVVATHGRGVWVTTLVPASQVQLAFRYSIPNGASGSLPPVLSYYQGGVLKTVQLNTSFTIVYADQGSVWNVSNRLPNSNSKERWFTNQQTSGIATSAENITLTYYHQYNVKFDYSVANSASGYSPPSVSFKQFGATVNSSLPAVSWVDALSNYFYTNPLQGSNSTVRFASNQNTGQVLSAGTVTVTYYKQYSLTLSCSLVNSQSAVTLAPAINYYSFGSAVSQLLSSVPSQYWVDSGTVYSAQSSVSSGTTRIVTSFSSKIAGSSASFVIPYYLQYLLTFEYSISGGGGSAPSLTYYDSGIQKQATLAGNESIWIDYGSTWSLTNPLPNSNNQERWFTNQRTSGSVASAETISITYYHQYNVNFEYKVVGGGNFSSPEVAVYQFGVQQTIRPNTTQWVDSNRYSYPEVLPGSSNSERWATNQKTNGTIASQSQVAVTYYHQFLVIFDYDVVGAGTGYSAPSVSYYSFGSASKVTANSTAWADSGTNYAYPAELSTSLSNERWINTANQRGTVSFSQTIISKYIHQLYVSIAVSGKGTAFPQSGWYNYSQQILIYAVQESGWSFQGWNGSLSIKANSTGLSVKSPLNLTAVFYPELTIVSGPSGTVIYAYDGSSSTVGAGSSITIAVKPGSLVKLSASPSSALYVFSGWHGRVNSTSQTVELELSNPARVSADFSLNYVLIGSVSSVVIAVGVASYGIRRWRRRSLSLGIT